MISKTYLKMIHTYILEDLKSSFPPIDKREYFFLAKENNYFKDILKNDNDGFNIHPNILEDLKSSFPQK